MAHLAKSRVKDKVGAVIVPGSTHVLNRKTGKLVKKRWLDIGENNRGRFIDTDYDEKRQLVAIARFNSEDKPVVNLYDLSKDKVIGTFEDFTMISSNSLLVVMRGKKKYVMFPRGRSTKFSSKPLRNISNPNRFPLDAMSSAATKPNARGLVQVGDPASLSMWAAR